MKLKSSVITSSVLMLVFASIGLTQFTAGIRNVQILGLFASGAAFGVGLVGLTTALKARKKEEA